MLKWLYVFLIKNGENALYIAARHGNREITKLLIDAGIDINAQNTVSG